MDTIPVPIVPENRVVELVAKCRLDGTRLDQYLAGLFPDLSRSVVQRVIEAAGVSVNGKTAKASYRVRTAIRSASAAGADPSNAHSRGHSTRYPL